MSFLTSFSKRVPTIGKSPLRSLSKPFHSQPSFKMAATLNSETISKITEKEKQITGQDEVVKGGPTAQAQSHVGEAIGSQQLHDITEGEKKITGGERIKGGPTAAAQSILSQVCLPASALTQADFRRPMVQVTQQTCQRPTVVSSIPQPSPKSTRPRRTLLAPMNLPKVVQLLLLRVTPMKPSTDRLSTTLPKAKRRLLAETLRSKVVPQLLLSPSWLRVARTRYLIDLYRQNIVYQ
jgi:hypothetical protein